MRPQHHSVSIHYARTLIAAARRSGLDHQQLIQSAGLNEPILENHGLRITPDQLSRLMQTLWQLSDDEFMGLGSQPSRQGVFTLMAKQAVHCRDLKAVYAHISHFYNLITDTLNLEFAVADNEARLIIRLTSPEKDPDYTLREFLLLLWHRFPSWLIGQRIPLRYVSLDYPEQAHQAEYRLMYPCAVHFNQPECMLVFGTEQLNAPVVQTTQSLRTYLRRAPLDWFKRQTYFQAYTRRVMDYLEREELAVSNMEQIAQELHVTSRTLRRKLREEGTSFQILKDEMRRDAAIHFLSQPSIPISDIARRLGFSEPASFTRAFRQWAGVAPSFYRSTEV